MAFVCDLSCWAAAALVQLTETAARKLGHKTVQHTTSCSIHFTVQDLCCSQQKLTRISLQISQSISQVSSPCLISLVKSVTSTSTSQRSRPHRVRLYVSLSLSLSNAFAPQFDKREGEIEKKKKASLPFSFVASCSVILLCNRLLAQLCPPPPLFRAPRGSGTGSTRHRRVNRKAGRAGHEECCA